MQIRRPLSPGIFAVLQAIGSGYRYGFDIMDRTTLPSGTVYPALSRLSKLGFVHSSWELQEVATEQKRPPRRYYFLTTAGEEALQATAAYYRALVNPGWLDDPSPQNA